MTDVLLALAVALGLGYAFAAGVQDASNAVATAVATRSLTPSSATRWAAVMVLVGALASWWLHPYLSDQSGLGVATTPGGPPGLAVLVVVLACTAGWLALMARQGLPVSTTHTLIGALVGAAVTTGAQVRWDLLATRVLAPMLLCAVVALVVAHVGTRIGRRLAMATDADRVEPAARVLLSAASTASAMFIGLLGSTKAILVLTLALTLAGRTTDGDTPFWVVLTAAVALAAGTAVGGRRIIATLGDLMVGHDVGRGAFLQTAAVTTFGVVALSPGLPVSTTHTVGSAVIGSGLVTPGRMRWVTARRVLVAWLVTLPVVAVVAGLLAGIAHDVVAALPNG
ncbi:anion permease [Georgenia sp. Z1491]|uniref:inorganic phosphate transporter n=1 Tax=Georgenia sp. Z1491 TaxID=3416707 RepID=UPI003CFBB7FA